MHLRSDSHRPQDRLRSGFDEPAVLLAGAHSPACLQRRRAVEAVVAGLLALGLALLLALLVASPAGAEARKFQLGVYGQGIGDADLASMGEGRVQTLRTIFSWAKAEQESGVRACNPAFVPEVYDSVVGEASRQGVNLLPVILGSPDYVAAKPQTAPHTQSSAIQEYRCFVRKLVARYGRGGTYPTLVNPAAAPIRSWQVWNEPNVRVYAARRKVSPREYGRLLKVTANEIRGEDRRANIVMAGMPELVRAGLSAGAFLRKLYKVKRIRSKFDVVAIHAYSENWKGVKGALIRIRRELARLGDRRRPMWITETGWASGGPKDSFFVKTERGQARQLTKAFRMIKANRKRFKLGSVHWYSWRDMLPPSTEGRWQDHSGLYRRDGSPKPSCRSFVRFTGGQCGNIESQSSVAGSVETLEPRGPSSRIIPSPPE